MINLSQIIQQGVVVFFIVAFIWSLFWVGMIFGFVGDYAERIGKEWPEWIRKPLYNCLVCMMPYYGSAVYWIFFKNDWIDWLLTIGVAAGLATVFVKVKKN